MKPYMPSNHICEIAQSSFVPTDTGPLKVLGDRHTSETHGKNITKVRLTLCTSLW